MKIWSSNDLNQALGVNTSASGNVVHFNSTDLSAGDIFIALASGHNYIKEAIEKGASCIIAEKYIDGIDREKFIIVPNSMDALEKMAIYKRTNSNAKFIGVTGSAGKTSTKDMIYNILKNFGNSFVSRGNFNNHLGVRLNLASMPNNLDYAIFEMGMNNPGEIKPLAHMVKPDIAIINNILDAHLGNFNSTLEIAKEKSDIFSAMNKDGIAILNLGDKHYDDCRKYSGLSNIYSFGADINIHHSCHSQEVENLQKTNLKNMPHVFTTDSGLREDDSGRTSQYLEYKNADSILTKYESSGYEATLSFSVCGENITLNTKITGMHNALNISAVLLLVKLLNLDIQKTIDYFAQISLVKGRGERTNVKINGLDAIIINDCYNASPSAMRYSLQALKEIDYPYKIAILADMKELGERGIEYHKALAPLLLEADVKCLYTIGPLMHNLHYMLKDKIKAEHFESSLALKEKIVKLITRPSIILLKGSNSMNLMALADFLTIENKL